MLFKFSNTNPSSMEFDLENPLTDFHDQHSETISSLFLSESDHMPFHHYSKTLQVGDFDVSVRREAISFIVQCSCNLDPFVSYLAVNYLDRFLSSRGNLQQPKPWVLRLLAISCVSLAAKMKKTNFSCAHFQVDVGFVFDIQTVERMEFIILDTLKWRMRSITPFSFISLFISLFKLKDTPLRQALKARAIEIIFKAQNDINLLGFKPSIIAGSALLYASHELFPSQFSCFNKAISNCSYVNKENLLLCYNLMQETAVDDDYQSIFDTESSMDTPVNVLDKQFLSSQSDKTNSTTTSPATVTVPRPERDLKRRKINGDYDYSSSNRMVQISQIQHC